MLIGIKDLDLCYGSLEMPGLFTITAPTFAVAQSILLQTIILNPDTKTALVSFEKRNGLFNLTPEINKVLSEIYDAGNLLLNVVYINESKHLLSKIKQDLEKKAYAEVELVLIDIEQDLLMSLTEGQLSTVLSAWQHWSVLHKKTCVWVIHGDMATGFIKNKFLSLNNMFNGLANIEFDVFEIKYELVFWHLYAAIQSNILLNLLFDEANNQITVINNSELASIPINTTTLSQSGNRVWVVKPEDELKEILPREWEILHTLDVLENDYMNNIGAATIIIYLNSSTDVNLTAKKILELRKNNGGRLKIIVRETEQCLRGVEEKFIINSGANLIIPYGVVFLRFISMVYAIQGSYLIRSVPNRIEDIYQVNLNDFGKSYLLLDDFARQVIFLVDSAQRMKINALLIKLTLNRNLPIEEITALIKIKRSGDIFTFTQDYLYLFLFQCEQSELRQALTHLIALPIEDLFLEQEYFCYIDEIRNEIAEIVGEGNELASHKKNEAQQTQMVNNIVSSNEKKPTRSPAILSPLKLKLG